MWCESHATTNNSNNSVVNVEDGLFEGDLMIPVEMIMAHYNLSSIPEGMDILSNDSVNASEANSNQIRRKRAAGSSIKLWPNGIVRYRISSSISPNVARNIRKAIASYESSTCLRFIPIRGVGDTIDFLLTILLVDYINFVSTGSGCYSYVGRLGARQVINLQDPECNSVGIIIHEIVHAIGFWHEQSRPDRDQYVTIHWDNIKKKKYWQELISPRKNDFMKRKYSEVDYQGSGYDYGSIMHYSRRAFSKNINKLDTITVNNPAEYS